MGSVHREPWQEMGGQDLPHPSSRSWRSLMTIAQAGGLSFLFVFGFWKQLPLSLGLTMVFPGALAPGYFSTSCGLHLNNSCNKYTSIFHFGVCHLFPVGTLTDQGGLMEHGADVHFCPCSCLWSPSEKGGGTQDWAAPHLWDNPG